MPTTIFIDKEGNVSGLADDTIDKLDSLGSKRVKRVSNVEFDHKAQMWVAEDMSGHIIAKHNVRSQVIEAEREYFNKCLEDVFSRAVML